MFGKYSLLAVTIAISAATMVMTETPMQFLAAVLLSAVVIKVQLTYLES